MQRLIFALSLLALASLVDATPLSGEVVNRTYEVVVPEPAAVPASVEPTEPVQWETIREKQSSPNQHFLAICEMVEVY